MVHKECYQAIEKELDRRGLDYEIHGLPGADDIIHYEEYWLFNLPVYTKLFPAIVDADKARDLDTLIVNAVKEHAEAEDTQVYYVVLCGEGWTDDKLEALRRQVAARLNTDIRIVIESLQTFTSSS